MLDELVYLRPDVIVEPLFNRWIVDVNLLAPIPAAMTMTSSHLPVLRSFLANPKLHLDAARNPALAGGPFVDAEASRVPEIEALLARTEREGAEAVRLAAAVKSLDGMLATETSGLSLDLAYKKVPELLRGYVELIYDLANRPAARFLEGMLYRSPFYRENAQSVALWPSRGDSRPFAYSTPRLDEPDRVFVDLPFRDARLDDLARMRHVPRSRGESAELLAIDPANRAPFDALFTATPPRRSERFSGPGVRVRFFGHACLLFESADAAILVDPTLGYPVEGGHARYTYDDLPDRLDAVLITHAHADHFSFEALLQLRHKTDLVVVPRGGVSLVDPALDIMLRRVGFPRVRAVHEMEQVDLPGAVVTALPFLGEHGDLDIRSKTAYAVRLGNHAFVAAADATGIEPKMFDLIKDELGPLEAVFLAMEPHGAPLTWGYGPMFTKPPTRKMDQSRRQRAASSAELVQILDRLRPKRFYNYAMGIEPWLHHLVAVGEHQVAPRMAESDEVVRYCQAQGIIAERPAYQLELVIP